MISTLSRRMRDYAQNFSQQTQQPQHVVNAVVKIPPFWPRRFLPVAAKILKPLTEVLRGNVAHSKRLTWTPEMAASFAASKQLLVSTVPLAHPDPTARILVAADASDTHIEYGVLEQAPCFFQQETVPHRDALRGI